MGISIGTKLGSVEVLGIIGRGGMGEVYRARDTKLKRDVAIKTLPDEFLKDADNVVRIGPHRLQIRPDRQRASYAKARVDVHERMDGSIAVYYEARCLFTQPAPSEAPVLRTYHKKAARPGQPQDRTTVKSVDNPFAKAARSLRQRASRNPPSTHPWKQKTRIAFHTHEILK